MSWLEERLAVQKYDEENARLVLADGLPRLERQSIQRRLEEIKRRVLEARRVGDEERALALTHEHIALSRSAHGLLQGTKG